MQLKKREPAVAISPAIATAACALLGTSPALAAGDGKWLVDTALMYYGEEDRVQALEPVLAARRDIDTDEFLDLKLTADVLTGASPNGAPVAPYAQTFTSPSGESQLTVPAGEVPLDDSFEDKRGSVALSWQRPLADPRWRSTLGAAASVEFDFFSLGLNGLLARDFNKRNTTVSAGLSVEGDLITPVGGVPDPLAQMNVADPEESKGMSHETKVVTDVLFGVTQVLGRRTLVQINYGYGFSHGYHNDPYKVVADTGAGGPPGDFYYESRPVNRERHALYGELRHALANGDAAYASYRITGDDWGVDTHTVDLRYRRLLIDDWFVEPHVRRYVQDAAGFRVESLTAPPVPGTYVSSDYRLGELTDTTLGARIGRLLPNDGEIGMRVESFRQDGDSAVADVRALILEFSYRYRW